MQTLRSRVALVALMGFGLILPAGLALNGTAYEWEVLVGSWLLTLAIWLGPVL